MIGILILVCIIPFAGYVTLQFPGIQTWITHKVIDAADSRIDGDISIGKISIVFFNKLIINDITICGEKGDTLASVGKIFLSLSPKELLQGQIDLKRLSIENGQFNLITENEAGRTNLKRIFRLPDQKDTLKEFSLPPISADDITIRNMAFSLINPYQEMMNPKPDRKTHRERDSTCVDFANLRLSEINVRLTRASYRNGEASCRIRDINCRDHSGYQLKYLSGLYSMNAEESRIDHLSLRDTWSEVNSEYLVFRYESGEDLQDFVNRIEMEADFHETHVDFRSIGAFAPALAHNHLQADVEGHVRGPVRALESEDFRIRSRNGTLLQLGFLITGLPEIENTIFNMNFKKIEAYTPEADHIVSGFSKTKGGSILSSILPEVKIRMNGLFYGTLLDFYTIGRLDSSAGGADFEFRSGNNPESGKMHIKGDLVTDNLHLGQLLNQARLGTLDADLSVNAEIDRKGKEGFSARLEKMNIRRLYFNGHGYRDLAASADLKDGSLNLKLLSRDKALSMLLQGIARFGKEEGLQSLKAFLDVPEADLRSMNLIRKGKGDIRLKMEADLKFKENMMILGEVGLNDIRLINENGTQQIDSLRIRSYLQDGGHFITLDCPLLGIAYSSSEKPDRILDRLKSSVLHPVIPPVHPEETEKIKNPDTPNGFLNLHLETYDTKALCQILHPGLVIADSTSIDFSLDEDDIYDMEVRSDYIFVGGKRFRNLLAKIDNDTLCSRIFLKGDKIILGGTQLENNVISALAKDGTIDFRYTFSNKEKGTDAMDLSSSIRFNRDTDRNLVTALDLKKSSFRFKNYNWTIDPARIRLSRELYDISGFRVHSRNSELKINGHSTPEKEDSIVMKLENFDVSIINSFVENDFNLQGLFSGKITAMNLFSDAGAIMNLNGRNVSLFDHEIDRMTILTKWDQQKRRFNILVNNQLHERNPLNLIGFFTPSDKSFHLNLSLDEFGLNYLTPFLSGIVAVESGSLSGDILISGQPDRLKMSSLNSRIDSLVFIPEYTRVPYMIHGPISIDEHQIRLDSIPVRDQFGSTAILNGKLSHTFLKDLALDADLTFRNFHCLNTEEKDNGTFYGSAFASGKVEIGGPVNRLKIDAAIQTERNTAIHVPLSSSSSANKSDLISYKSMTELEEIDHHSEAYIRMKEKELAEKGKKVKSDIQIKAAAKISQGTEILVEMNKESGEVLRCIGNGNVEATVNPAKNLLDLRGDYTISEGSYHLDLSILSKDFLLNDGGKISFNGDFRNTTLDAGATYRTKASISTLIADTTSVGNRRNVNCGINLQGNIINPEVSFTIDIPDLDPITKGKVESALSTPDKIQRQFMALLVSGSFVPDEQSGIVNSSTILYSNASEILSNQFNNIFRQLDIPLDLGLNYQPGSTNGEKDMFDVAISYQAFNNRLVINGNVGTSHTSSNWAGDFEAEVKVDRNGKFRITLFTRSSDSYSNYLDNTQRSGIGFTFQDEFDSFGELWRNIFFSKKRREAYELELMEKAKEELKKEALIQYD